MSLDSLAFEEELDPTPWPCDQKQMPKCTLVDHKVIESISLGPLLHLHLSELRI